MHTRPESESRSIQIDCSSVSGRSWSYGRVEPQDKYLHFSANLSFKSETIMRFSLLAYFLGLSRLIFGLKYEVNLQYLGSKIQRSVIDKQYPEGIGIPTPRLQQLVLSSAGDGSTPPSHVPHDIESEYGVYNNLGRRGARKTCFPSFCPSPFQHRYSGWPSRCETPRTR